MADNFNDSAGPFTKYLTAPMEQPQARPTTGWESNTGAIVHAANSFLDAMRRTRLQKFAQDELQRETQRNSINTAIQAVANSGLGADEKQQLMAPLQNNIIALAQLEPTTSQHTGHPVTDFFKNLLTSATGGQLPKTSSKYDPNAVNLALTRAFGNPGAQAGSPESMGLVGDPTHQAQYRLGDIDNKIDALINQREQESTAPGGKAFTQLNLWSDPEIGALRNQGRQINPNYVPTAFTTKVNGLPLNDAEAMKQKANLMVTQAGLNQAQSMLGAWGAQPQQSAPPPTPPTGQVGTQQPSTPDNITIPTIGQASTTPHQSPEATVAPTTSTQTSPTPASQNQTLSNLKDILKYNNEVAVAKFNPLIQQFPGLAGNEVKIDPPAPFFNPATGGIENGHVVDTQTVMRNGRPVEVKGGIYASIGGELIPGARIPTEYDKKSIPPEQMANLLKMADTSMSSNFRGVPGGDDLLKVYQEELKYAKNPDDVQKIETKAIQIAQENRRLQQAATLSHERMAETMSLAQIGHVETARNKVAESLRQQAIPVLSQLQRLERLNDTLSVGGPVAEALIPPELINAVQGNPTGNQQPRIPISEVTALASKSKTKPQELVQWFMSLGPSPRPGMIMTQDQKEFVQALTKRLAEKVSQRYNTINTAQYKLAEADDLKTINSINAGLMTDLGKIDGVATKDTPRQPTSAPEGATTPSAVAAQRAARAGAGGGRMANEPPVVK